MWSVDAEASLGLKSHSIVVSLVKHDCHVRRDNHLQGDVRAVSLHWSLKISLLESNETIRNENGVIVLLPNLGSKTPCSVLKWVREELGLTPTLSFIWHMNPIPY